MGTTFIKRPNLVISNDSGNYFLNGTGFNNFSDVTNLSVTITSTGNPVSIALITQVKSAVAEGFISALNMSANAIAQISVNRVTNGIDTQATVTWFDGLNALLGEFFVDPVSAGTHTYRIRVAIDSPYSVSFQYIRLKAHELA